MAIVNLVMLSVTRLSVNGLYVVMPRVTSMNVIMLSVNGLIVVMLRVTRMNVSLC